MKILRFSSSPSEISKTFVPWATGSFCMQILCKRNFCIFMCTKTSTEFPSFNSARLKRNSIFSETEKTIFEMENHCPYKWLKSALFVFFRLKSIFSLFFLLGSKIGGAVYIRGRFIISDLRYIEKKLLLRPILYSCFD